MAQTCVIARILCGAGYAVFPFSLLGISRGDGAPSGASSPSVGGPFGTAAPLGAPSRRFPSGAGPRFLNRGIARRSASSWRGTVVSPGGAPVAARVQEERSSPARRRRIQSRQHDASWQRPRWTGRWRL